MHDHDGEKKAVANWFTVEQPSAALSDLFLKSDVYSDQ